MLVRGLGWFAILLALSLSTAGGAEQCRLAQLPPIPVTMMGWRPTVPAELNGHETRLLVDTGAFFDALSPAEATEFNLPISRAPNGLYVTGGLGDLYPRIATVRELRLGPLSFHRSGRREGGGYFGQAVERADRRDKHRRQREDRAHPHPGAARQLLLRARGMDVHRRGLFPLTSRVSRDQPVEAVLHLQWRTGFRSESGARGAGQNGRRNTECGLAAGLTSRCGRPHPAGLGTGQPV